MNIFVLDKNPYISAQMMCDAHVVKMIVESCQLLSTHDNYYKHKMISMKRFTYKKREFPEWLKNKN